MYQTQRCVKNNSDSKLVVPLRDVLFLAETWMFSSSSARHLGDQCVKHHVHPYCTNHMRPNWVQSLQLQIQKIRRNVNTVLFTMVALQSVPTNRESDAPNYAVAARVTM